MTRQKTMSDQQYYDLRFSDWIRERCPSSATGWTCSDVDYVVHQYKSKQLVLLEVKRWRTGPSQGKVQTAQRHILRMLHSCLSLGMRELFPEYTYHGVWLIQFDCTWFDDGLCWFTYDQRVDAVPVTEEQLLKILSDFDRVGPLENEY